MGVRGEIFSTKVSLQNRTYFFNVKENRLGDLYLNIVESKNRDEGGFERQSVILFAEDLQDFLLGFDESLKILERAVREKRKGKSPAAWDKGQDRDDAEPGGSSRHGAGGGARGGVREGASRGAHSGTRNGASGSARSGSRGGAHGGTYDGAHGSARNDAQGRTAYPRKTESRRTEDGRGENYGRSKFHEGQRAQHSRSHAPRHDDDRPPRKRPQTGKHNDERPPRKRVVIKKR
jgi:hypothetical protein